MSVKDVCSKSFLFKCSKIALMTKLANCFTKKKGNIVLNYPELLKLQRLVGDGENSMMAYEIKNPKKNQNSRTGRHSGHRPRDSTNRRRGACVRRR